MDLNDYQHFSLIDQADMLGHIDGLPDQLQEAWRLGSTLPLPQLAPVRNIVVAGMGGSAIGADLLASYLSDTLQVPFFVQRDYGLPAFAAGNETLLVASSHSGNTEEVLSAFQQGLKNGCQLMAVCTGGKLEAKATEAGVPVWKFAHSGQPRTAVGFSFGLILALLTRIGLVQDPHSELQDAVEVMKALQSNVGAAVPLLKNPAKRQAGQLFDRHVTFFAGGFMSPVARRWKTQFNEVAKTFTSFEPIPEADHNTLAGIINPVSNITREFSFFITASADNPRNQLRMEKTRAIMMLEGVGTDVFHAKGETRLAQMWSSILYGDYLAYYLALAYDTDPTPIPPIAALKIEMTG